MMRFFAYALAIIILLTIIRMIAGFVIRSLASLSDPQAKARRAMDSEPRGGVLKQDPVCGTYVASGLAVRSVTDGREYFFCSDDCKRTFAAGGAPAQERRSKTA